MKIIPLIIALIVTACASNKPNNMQYIPDIEKKCEIFAVPIQEFHDTGIDTLFIHIECPCKFREIIEI